MANLLEQAINCDDGGGAARIIMDALGIETGDLAKHCLKNWPTDRKRRGYIIGNWLQEEAEFSALDEGQESEGAGSET
jgi:hypothetical protein